MNRELLKQVLDALKLAVLRSEKIIDKEYDAAITALEAELAKPDPEPVAWVHASNYKMPGEPVGTWVSFDKDEPTSLSAVPLYTAPHRSPTDAELVELARDSKNREGNSMLPVAFACEVETLVTGARNCSRHPAAPHGFDRNGSHAAGRHVCTCESWSPGDAS